MDQQKKMIAAQEIFEEREQMLALIKPYISESLQLLILKKINAERATFLVVVPAESHVSEIPKAVIKQDNPALNKNFFVKKPLIL